MRSRIYRGCRYRWKINARDHEHVRPRDAVETVINVRPVPRPKLTRELNFETGATARLEKQYEDNESGFIGKHFVSFFFRD